MNDGFILPPAMDRGDSIAVVGTGNGPTSDVFEQVYELGKKRLRDVFDLEPVEYPTATMSMDERTRRPEKRAEDLMDAFRNDDITGVIAPIGGSGEQIRILKHLDSRVLRKNPTRFYGYSDNTSLNLYLWKHGIISFNGPMVMTEMAMQGEMHEYTIRQTRKAFFEDSMGEVKPAESFTDETLEWGNPENLERRRELEENSGWKWHNDDGRKVSGRVWGGCLKVMAINLQSGKPLPEPEQLNGKILALETSEEMPDENFVDRFMMSLGERGLLERFSAVVIGRAKARHNDSENTPEERKDYRKKQRKAIRNRIDEYTPETPVLFDFDFGHTDPIVPLPIGGVMEIDTGRKEVEILFNPDHSGRNRLS